MHGRLPLVLPDLDIEVQIALLQIHSFASRSVVGHFGCRGFACFQECDLVLSAQLWRPRVCQRGAASSSIAAFHPLW